MMLFGFTEAQITILVEKLPTNTSPETRLYLASSLNNWNPKDVNFELKKNAENQFQIQINADKDFDFKITQGSWDSSEANKDGSPIDNHKVNINTVSSLKINIKNWTRPQEKQHSTTSNVKILSENFNIPQLKTTRRIWIYLPPNYDSTSKKYPVIYMHDGQNLFDNATSFSGEWGVDETMNQISENHQLDAIIIGIDNGGDARLDEYSPWKNTKYQKGGEGNQYIDFITQTLKPYIDKRYRTLPQPKNTALIGSSMGGLISLYGGVKYPKIFGRIGIFSPAFWFVSKDLNYFVNKNRNNLRQSKFYFIAGQNEDAGMPQEIENIKDLLLQKKVPERNISVKIDADGTHSETYWRREFGNAVLWLLRR
ncbi:Predicted hydrolase of the alpha/beta superfamily [Soonwooa buanensis]|uniref:Predicted hydrolase of the alpha/beta superfamily n=2 Tax=Soonwooa buanensis TaxID=619805 RepID=A0A1T5CRT2_9FLAO|nr:Predicted hydrolase of the alpha/beta superfamily [Soonwooa buanensis]